jgi:undecaprenyl-diphosphatase
VDWLQALLLGLVQGLTEFLPVSSSGHLELGKVILGIETQEDLTFTVVVHGATVLSTIIVFWRELWRLLRGAVRVKLNEETNYLLKIGVSMIPVLFVGIFLEDWVESFSAETCCLSGRCYWLLPFCWGLPTFLSPVARVSL